MHNGTIVAVGGNIFKVDQADTQCNALFTHVLGKCSNIFFYITNSTRHRTGGVNDKKQINFFISRIRISQSRRLRAEFLKQIV